MKTFALSQAAIKHQHMWFMPLAVKASLSKPFVKQHYCSIPKKEVILNMKHILVFAVISMYRIHIIAKHKTQNVKNCHLSLNTSDLYTLSCLCPKTSFSLFFSRLHLPIISDLSQLDQLHFPQEDWGHISLNSVTIQKESSYIRESHYVRFYYCFLLFGGL